MRSVTPSRYGADDWIRTSIIRFTKPVPSYSATSAKHECKDSNPVRQFWRPTALPGAHSCKGYPTGIEPVSASQSGVRNQHRTRPQRKGEGFEPSEPRSSTGLQPDPVARHRPLGGRICPSILQ